MNGFILFVGQEYAETGGWTNYEACYPTLEEAKEAGMEELKELGNDWFHVVDTSTERIVAQVKK